MCFNRVYDFQRAFCEDSELIERWFRLTYRTYVIRGCYVFRILLVPTFLIVKGEYHLSNWYTEGDLPYDWLIKPTINGWTDNETVLNRYKNHKSPAFQEYYKEHNIILLSLLSHSSHLTQSLDISYFGPLKRSYNRQIENFIKVYITHIIKTKFFQTFKATYIEAISISNGKAGFRGAGLIPFNPEIVLSKLDIRIRTSSNRSISADPDIWQSQISHNPIEALSQSTLVKSRIARHQGSSPTPIFETVAALAKGTELLAYTNTLLIVEIHNLYKANEVFSKH
ncbi:hypothetical protein SS1G_02016 [Sclerotinia sclerotiorum 1980 UF-70]|uniref:DDE-1 domain-containing protein n=1 Tax=Sclerotinia sclerotiorum (strain ATCC 18683 / 1980 / Ss-1) TaxID=665079 RepID=A7E9N6_SCLS1|nr:hypothetical protein SS1G_02016 [Sclerotinia sclerotiorum 1980 UF-70]EDN97088.1 hypothetical protein SS1G_02016 [Sclerotinia sclerotiorum 1980 UF-70]